MLKKKNILVTGGAGFIASHIVDRYIALGNEVMVIDDLSSGSMQNLNPSAAFIKADIRTRDAQNAIKEFKPDIINHHAAQIDVRKSVINPALDASINIMGMLSILEIAVKLNNFEKIIFSSTGGAIYGDTDIIPTPEDHPTFPTSPYGISKLTSEHYLRFYHENYGFNYICLRYGNVYGPRQNPHGEAGVVAIFTKAMLEGKTPIIHGDGKQTRDFIFVSDVVDANQRALEYKTYGIFNVGTGKETNVMQIIKSLKKSIQTTIDPTHGPAKKGEQRRSCLLCQKAHKQLGWKAVTDLDSGIQQTVTYFKGQ